MAMTNAIIDYFKGCKNLDTPEGRKLVSDSDDITLQEAADGDQEVAQELLRVSKIVRDNKLRRKILKAIIGY